MRPVRRQDFSYELPEELIAQSPLAERSASRLLVLDGATGGMADRGMGDLPGYLKAGDLLVFNDTRVVAARIVGSKPSGGRVEIFLERVKPAETAGRGREALVQLRASKPVREGLEIATAGGVVRVLGREDELWRVETPGDALEFFEAWGEVPLPPYIHRAADASDRERYQSIFAREKGAVAAPTASLHFDAALVARLEAMGVGRAFVTLHVGAGTFQPLRTDDLDAHKMHAERVSVSRETWDAIQRTRAAGGRVIAVGTTVVRALEAAALEAAAPGSAAPELAAPGSMAPESVAPESAAHLASAVGRSDPVAGGHGEPTTETSERVPPSMATSQPARERALSSRAMRRFEGVSTQAAGEVSGTRNGVFDPDYGGVGAVGAGVGKGKVAAVTGGEDRLRARASEVPEARADEAPAARTQTGQIAWSGETRLFIRPGFKFQVVDAMVTNFHLPESTLLMLVSAFAGRENVLAAYAHAVRERYRFFSYGDAMFVMPAKPTEARAP